MDKKGKIVLAALVALLAVAGVCAAIFMNGDGDKKGENTTGGAVTADKTVVAGDAVLPDSDAVQNVSATISEYKWKENVGSTIKLNGDSATASGSVEISGKDIIINEGGQYEITGTLNDGRIIVKAKGEEVYLKLNNANINCSYSSPLYIYKAEKATIILADGTANSVSDSSNYNFDDKYSVNGEVTDKDGNTSEEMYPNAAIYSKKDLCIQGSGKLVVNGNFEQGITGKDNLEILGSTVVVKSVNKGIKGKDSLLCENATITVDSVNDGLSSKGNISVCGGAMNLKSEKKGIQADGDVSLVKAWAAIDAGTEGIEGKDINFDSSNVSAIAKDDGINANGTTAKLVNTNLVINASGDGIDSNGSIYIDGGLIIVYGSDREDNAALDYEERSGSFEFVSGTLLAVGTSRMACAPTKCEVSGISVATGMLEAGEVVNVKVGDTNYSFNIIKNASHFVLITPEMTSGQKVSIETGGKSAGDFNKTHLVAGASYTGGSEITSITLENGINSYGNAGMNGGFNGKGDGFGGHKDFENRPEGGFPGGERPDKFAPDGDFNPQDIPAGERPDKIK